MPALPAIEVPERFNGPPGSGNGGYSAGLLAAQVDAPAVEVTLRAPPPLNRPLVVEARDGATVALDGDAVVLEARPVDLDLEAPAPVGMDDAQAADAISGFRDHDVHPFPTCVVCGPDRDPGDGLRMFPGPLADGRFATVFRPDASLADEDGVVEHAAVWAALDCPSSGPVLDMSPGAAATRAPSVLARLAVRIDEELRVGEAYVSVSWKLGEDGRKRTSGTALYTADGRPVAVARALWIELRA
ncbi:hypothetical protein LRS13_03765 [Svornostia abyssi]|uniref:Thioesterase family protein n=1 Tax=Svornostia abyssi TaxID=2898438 RepID=A0ABY5PJ03_9ACTN|nr:hypothetical protein LRS13_03765 [Parviterribacteraceae bacterium J379]